MALPLFVNIHPGYQASSSGRSSVLVQASSVAINPPGQWLGPRRGASVTGTRLCCDNLALIVFSEAVHVSM